MPQIMTPYAFDTMEWRVRPNKAGQVDHFVATVTVYMQDEDGNKIWPSQEINLWDVLPVGQRNRLQALYEFVERALAERLLE